MPRKRSGEQDPMRRMVQGILTLLLTTLASWLAVKITDMILRQAKKGPAEQAEEA